MQMREKKDVSKRKCTLPYMRIASVFFDKQDAPEMGVNRSASWSDDAWQDYWFWQDNDKKMLKRINALIKDIKRSPFVGIGDPEPLKHQLSGFWSRRIDREHRLVYTVADNTVMIAQCRYHY
jgi:toxin YoeB